MGLLDGDAPWAHAPQPQDRTDPSDRGRDDGPVVPWAPSEPSDRIGLAAGPGVVFAQTRSRFAAFVIDGLVLEIVFAFVLLASRWGVGLDLARSATVALVARSLLSPAYFVASWTGGRRATPGQRLFRIEVARSRGQGSLGLADAFLRWLALGEVLRLLALVPGLGLLNILRLGWWMVLLATTVRDPTRRGLHDRLAHSSVVQPEGATRDDAIALGFLAVFATIFVAVGAAVLAGESDPPRLGSSAGASSGTSVKGAAPTSAPGGSDHAVPVVTLTTGQCFDLVSGAAGDPAAVVRPCTDPHSLETIVVFTFPAGASDDYPGDSTIRKFVDPRCAAAFAAYVGRPDTTSVYNYAYLIQTRSAWDAGERRIPCGAGSDDRHQKIQGSVKDANR